MSLSKVKNKLSNVFQLLERTDLSVTEESNNSIAEQVDLDLATIYPHYSSDTVTPHIAYLYNTRMGWVQMGTSPFTAFETTPVNAFYSGSSNYSGRYRNYFTMYNFENCNRTNGLITSEDLSRCLILGGTSQNHDYKFDRMLRSYNFSKSDYNKYEIFNTYIAGYMNKTITGVFNLSKVHLKQTYASALCINEAKILHNANDITVKINPLRTINSNTNQVIGSSNEYINMTGVMTVLIYSDKLVYIRHDGLNFTYKIYSYPNLSLIKTGTETSLRDIYIKNNITREGLIGPTGSNEVISDGERIPLFHDKGFVLNIQRTDSRYNRNFEYDLRVIDLYNIVGPMIVVTDDLINAEATAIYYL